MSGLKKDGLIAPSPVAEVRYSAVNTLRLFLCILYFLFLLEFFMSLHCRQAVHAVWLQKKS